MNFSELYECWRFAEILTHPHNVERHNLLQNRISAIIQAKAKRNMTIKGDFVFI